MTPNDKFVDEVKAKFPDPSDDKIAIGCQVGGRSAKAAQVLDQVIVSERNLNPSSAQCNY